jgi:hypothetical protein
MTCQVPDAEPCSSSCAALYTVHEETEMQQVRGGLSLADTQSGCYVRFYSRRYDCGGECGAQHKQGSKLGT